MARPTILEQLNKAMESGDMDSCKILMAKLNKQQAKTKTTTKTKIKTETNTEANTHTERGTQGQKRKRVQKSKKMGADSVPVPVSVYEEDLSEEDRLLIEKYPPKETYIAPAKKTGKSRETQEAREAQETRKFQGGQKSPKRQKGKSVDDDYDYEDEDEEDEEEAEDYESKIQTRVVPFQVIKNRKNTFKDDKTLELGDIAIDKRLRKNMPKVRREPRAKTEKIKVRCMKCQRLKSVWPGEVFDVKRWTCDPCLISSR